MHRAYGRYRVLRGCDLEVRQGQVVGITGENGSGKTTLAKCLLGFLRPGAGTVSCTDFVGYCPQEEYLHRSYIVSEHFRLVASLRRTEAPVDPDYLRPCLAVLKLEPYLRFPIRKLSGGTYQKVRLLTAIARRPRLLVLDEPTDGFDWTGPWPGPFLLLDFGFLRTQVAPGEGVSPPALPWESPLGAARP